MSTRTDSGGEDPIIECRDQLIALFEQGEKPPEKWKIGTEHEKFVYARKAHHPPSYPEEGGIRALLMGLTHYGWEPVLEAGTVISLSGSDGAISMKPAGQWALCGAPRTNLHETCAEIGQHLEQVKNDSDNLGLGFTG